MLGPSADCSPNAAGLSCGLLLTIGLVIGGCDAGAPAMAGEGFTLTDSAGVQIAQNHWVDEEHLPEWRLEEEPFFSVGDPAPSTDYELHQVGSARSFPDGRVLVTVGNREVRIFSPEGEHLLTAGKVGEGPGEFMRLADAHPLGDTAVQVLDPQQRRVLVYDARSGAFLQGRTHDMVFIGNQTMPLSDGSFAGFAQQWGDPAPTRSARHLVRFGPAGVGVDTLSLLTADVTDDPTIWAYFNPNFASTAAGDRVWAGWGDELEIFRYREDGTLEHILRNTMPGEPLTDTLRADAPTELPDGVRLQLPDRLPVFGVLKGTPSGWLWVRRYMSNVEQARSDTRIWDIYDPEGRQTAFFRAPMNARIYEVGDDHVLGVFLTAYEVETVRKYRLSKPDG